MPDRHDRSRPGQEAASEGHAGDNHDHTAFARISENERLVIGTLINCPPSTRDRVFAMLVPDDFQHPPCGDAFGILALLHSAGVHDTAELVNAFMDHVNSRRRATRRPGDEIPLKYAEGPASWLARCFTAAARMPDVESAVVLALPMVGTGRRRAIAHAASELARAAANLEFDEDDVQAAAERLVPLLPVVGR